MAATLSLLHLTNVSAAGRHSTQGGFPGPTFADMAVPDARHVVIEERPELPAASTLPPDTAWELVFSDDFDGASLDSNKWVTCFWWGSKGGCEAQHTPLTWYQPQNVAVSDGTLKLVAANEPFTTPDGKTYPYTSGMITTAKLYSDPFPYKFTFTYGYMEMRAKLPRGQGMWPAFWAVPPEGKAPPEIDVMEFLGHEANIVHMGYHYLDDQGVHRVDVGSWTGPDFSADWHLFALDWRPDAIVWYVDGVERRRFTGPYVAAEPMYLIANLQVGGDWPGNPDPSTSFPSTYEIDFIRVYAPSQLPPATFADVPWDHPYHDEIEALYQAGFTAGCSSDPLLYCPEQTMNRAESAVFVERGIHSAGYSPPDPTTQAFADLPLDSWAAKWVNGLWEDQYTAGCGTAPPVYCPWQGHTRAEGAVFYLRMLNGANYVPAEPTQPVFSDVPLDAWFAKWIHAAYQAGLITPCETSPQMRFCPNDPLTRALAAYMMVQAKGLLAENGPYCTPRVYWGALASGSTYGRDNPPWDMGTVDVFESHTQKKISILHFGHPWYSPAPCWPDGYYPLLADLLDRLRQRGVIPLLDWASWSKCDASTENDADFSLARIIAGQHDEFIRQFARDARNWGHPFFLRFDWEMNGDWYPWSERINGNSPGEFVQAWRHVHDIFTSEGATNVSWVWCVNTEYPGSIPIEDLYPGDDYVDWLAVDGYNWGTQNPTHPDTWKSFAEVFRATYDRLVRLSPNKPIMIAETASSEYGGSKPNWITDALTVQLPTYFPKADAFVWFNWDMDNANWVIESSAQSQSAFAQGIGSTYYSASDFSTLEVSPIPALPHATCP